MPKKFTLPEKSCTLGTKFTTTGDGEGAARDSQLVFALEGLMLSAKDLDKMLGAGAHERLFTKDKSQALVPFFGEDINEQKLAHKYIDCTVTLTLDGATVTAPKANISKVVLQPQIGGMTWMSCEIEAPAKLAHGHERIGKHCDLKIAAQLAFGEKPKLDKRQKALPLNEGEEHDTDAAAPPVNAKKPNGRHRPAAN
jgi:hypothetical protein